MYKLIFVFLSLLFSFAAFHSATAQDIPKQFSTVQEQNFQNLPPPEDIEARHLVEMDKVYEDCMTDYFDSGHKDCKCLAMTYLQERMKYPNVDKKVISQTIQASCYDIENMKGHYFGICTNNIKLTEISPRKDPVALCNCFGESIARNIPNMNRLTYKTLQRLQTRAYIECEFFN